MMFHVEHFSFTYYLTFDAFLIEFACNETTLFVNHPLFYCPSFHEFLCLRANSQTGRGVGLLLRWQAD